MTTTNFTSVETIKDTNDTLVVKFIGHIEDANGAEIDVLKVNAESLLHRTGALINDGTNTHVHGGMTLYALVKDAPGTNAGNVGVGYGVNATVWPLVAKVASIARSRCCSRSSNAP